MKFLGYVWKKILGLRRSSRCDRVLDDHYTQILTDYERIDPEQISPRIAKAKSDLDSCFKQDRLTWTELLAFERLILTILQDSDISARAWLLRERYRNIATKDQYALYEKTHDPAASGETLRKDLDCLLLALTEYYSLRNGIERERTEFSHRVQLMTGVLLLTLGLSHPAVRGLLGSLRSHVVLAVAAGLSLSVIGWWAAKDTLKTGGIAVAILALTGWLVASTGTPAAVGPAAQDLSNGSVCADNLPPFVTTLVMVIIAGLFGGAFSMLQRVQMPILGGDSLTNLMSLRTARREILLAPIIGAVGALVLYCIFDAELLKGTLFPLMFKVTSANGSQSFARYLCASGPVSGTDEAKLLVWSFVAGFSERLLPDALDRLTKQTVPGGASGK